MATATAVFDIGPYGKIDKSYFLESTNMIQSKLYMSSLSLDGVLRTWNLFTHIRNPRLPPLQNSVKQFFTIRPYGKMNKCFFLGITSM